MAFLTFLTIASFIAEYLSLYYLLREDYSNWFFNFDRN